MKTDKENFQYNQNSLGGKFEMTVTSFVRDMFMKELGFEIEMLQGEYKPMSDGMHYYKFEIPVDKIEVIKLFFQALLDMPNLDGSIKVMSYPVNNN